MTDQELVARLREDDHEAFAWIFRTHYAQLVGVAEAVVGDVARGEDVVQDVFLELWRRRDRITLEATLRAYLFRATRNRALNLIRHERVVRRAAPFVATDVATGPVGTGRLVEREIDAAVQAAVAELPARCREVFELSRVHQLRYAEIATVLDISVKTVEAQMGKALRSLREKLAAWLPDTEDP